MRVASPTRVYLPQESSSTMIMEPPENVPCITRQRPASAIYPVFDKPMSQWELRVRLLVLPKRIMRRPTFTWSEVEVVKSRILGYACAAWTSLARSCAVDTLRPESPVPSSKRLPDIPRSWALRFIARTQESLPPGYEF